VDVIVAGVLVDALSRRSGDAREAHEEHTCGAVLRERRERRALRDERDGVNEWM